MWPLSRQSFPKQFLTLSGESSLLQATVRRCAGITAHPPVLLTQEASRFIVAQQLRDIGLVEFTLMLEPMQRGTAPALVCAALCLKQQFGDALMLALPSDHLLTDMDEFVDAAKLAIEAAHGGWLMTFGIRPDAPETGYGYLRAGQRLEDRLIRLSAFIEKPDANAIIPMDSWDVNCYFVPVFSGVMQAAAGKAEKKMKEGLDKSLQQNVLLFKGKADDIKAGLKIDKNDSPWFFVLDAAGKVLYSTSGAFSEAKMEEIEKALSQ